MARVLRPVPQTVIETIAHKSTYVLNINPRQILINNVGIDGYVGGGNLWVGDSAANLDDVLVHLATYPRATIELDTGVYYEQWTPVTVEDVRRLRAAFFALYGLGKQNWYGPPIYPPLPPPTPILADDQSPLEFQILLDSSQVEDAYLGVG